MQQRPSNLLYFLIKVIAFLLIKMISNEKSLG